MNFELAMILVGVFVLAILFGSIFWLVPNDQPQNLDWWD